jgi:hypothetical protein
MKEPGGQTVNRLAAMTIAFAVLLLTAGACGGGDDKTIDVGNGDEVTVSDDLPDEFPDDFPVYDGADLQGAVRGEQDGVEGIVATWTTGDDLDDVTNFYEDAFENGAWASVTNGAAGGSTYWAVEENDGDKVGYVAVSGGDEVTIIATVGDDPNAQADPGDTGDGATDPSTDGGDSSGDEASDSGDGTDVSADLPDEVDLPEGFPSDLVPLPDSARVTTAQSYSADGTDTFLVGFHTKDTAQEVGDYYKRELEGKGFTQSLQTSDANGVYAAYAENADGTGTIVVISVNAGSIEGYREGVVQVTAS